MTDYYIRNTSGSAGDDTNDGSIESPWLTYDKARAEFETSSDGDTFSFYGGDTFTYSLSARWNLPTGSVGDTRTVKSYGTGKAIISPDSGLDGFIFQGPEFAPYVGGAVLDSLVIERSQGSNTDTGVFMYGCVNVLTINNCEISGFNIAVYATTRDPGSLTSNMPLNLSITNCYIHHTYTQGTLGSSDSLLIEDNTFDYCALSPSTLNHSIYIGGHYEADDIIIRGNTITNSVQSAGGNASGTALVVHGWHTNLTIENNHFIEAYGTPGEAAYSIQIDDGNYAGDEAFYNVIIRENIVESPGRTSISVDCTDGLYVYNNSFYLTGIIVYTPPAKAIDINLTSNGNPNETDNVEVYNNLMFYDVGEYSSENMVDIDPLISTQTESNNEAVSFTPPLNFQVLQLPTKGYLSGVSVSGAFSYDYETDTAPDTDSFTYKINDTVGTSNTATVNLTITT